MTMNNVVMLIAVIIALGWAWASVQVVQKNYILQRQVDDKHRELQLVQLETDNLAYEQRYYQSSEYLSLEVRTRLGLGDTGEKTLLLPPNSAAAKADMPATSTVAPTATGPEPGNFQQWANFLFGGAQRSS